MTTLWRRVRLAVKETNQDTTAVTEARNKISNKSVATERKRKHCILNWNQKDDQQDLW